ncbi:hypothetical protein [Neobacillus sedimentimangrovi]|uniref:hypothetical protein n=1 Tax=Neobacillus sedimentimangrovi TaxID=2699460 RepID=UPI003D7BF745
MIELQNIVQKGDILLVTKLDIIPRNAVKDIEIVKELFSRCIRVHVATNHTYQTFDR